MTIEQKQLLYDIAKLHSSQFYNSMVDHWESQHYAFDREYTARINELEAEYKKLYGDLPEWKYIDDVWVTIDTLGKELQEE